MGCVSECPSAWAGWHISEGTNPPLHTVQQVLMTEFRDHLGSTCREAHKGGPLKGVGTEEKNDMKSPAHFSAHE